MITRYPVHPEATAELRAEAIYLNRQATGLGYELLQSARRARKEVEDDPKAWPPVDGWNEEPEIRSRRVGRFRLRLVYYIGTDERVYIIAYAHESREPGYWHHRING